MPPPSRPEQDISLTIHNLASSTLHLTNTAHAFLEPVAIPSSSLGPLAYLPTDHNSRSLDLVFSTSSNDQSKSQSGQRGDAYGSWRVCVPRKGTGKSWKTGGWERLHVERIDGSEGIDNLNGSGSSRSSSDQSSGRTLRKATESNRTLKAFRMKVPPAQSPSYRCSSRHTNLTSMHLLKVTRLTHPARPHPNLYPANRFLDVILARLDVSRRCHYTRHPSVYRSVWL